MSEVVLALTGVDGKGGEIHLVRQRLPQRAVDERGHAARGRGGAAVVFAVSIKCQLDLSCECGMRFGLLQPHIPSLSPATSASVRDGSGVYEWRKGGGVPAKSGGRSLRCSRGRAGLFNSQPSAFPFVLQVPCIELIGIP